MFLLTFLIGLLMLVGGAHFLVEGGGRLAVALRVPSVVVGLTIVAFGTSAPELTVSVTAAVYASTDMAMSNVNGSNIANIFFVLGLAALVRPIPVKRELLARDAPSMLVLQALVLLLSFDGVFSRIDGFAVLVTLIGYYGWLFYDVRTGRSTVDDELGEGGTLATNLVKLIGGLVVLLVGATLFVESAVEVARYLHFSDRLIGLTVVALGTSAPEAVTAVQAARNGDVDMAVGGSIGSNILNIGMVLGLTAMIQPIDLSAGGFLQDMCFALFAAALLIPLSRMGTIQRSGGAAMILIYLAYMGLGVYQGLG